MCLGPASFFSLRSAQAAVQAAAMEPVIAGKYIHTHSVIILLCAMGKQHVLTPWTSPYARMLKAILCSSRYTTALVHVPQGRQ
jgi:hypothetical protein